MTSIFVKTIIKGLIVEKLLSVEKKEFILKVDKRHVFESCGGGVEDVVTGTDDF